jgi:ABC-type antimicrobial peptide transport system permease subunit
VILKHALHTDVTGLIMLDGHRLALFGLVLGLTGAYAGGRVVASSVYEMRASDPTILATAGVLAIVITLTATMIPAIRATRLNPVHALRSE